MYIIIYIYNTITDKTYKTCANKGIGMNTRPSAYKHGLLAQKTAQSG